MNRVRWLRLALSDLDEILTFIAADKPGAAAAMAKRVHDAVALLPEQPAMGRPGRVVGTRELVISGTPLIVPYRCIADEIQILRVFHGSKRWPRQM